MNNIISAIIGVIQGILIVAILVLIFDFIGISGDARIEGDIEDMFTDIFSPETMEQFDTSRQKYEGELITTAVADRLYKKYADELTEEDLQRSIDVEVVKSEVNSFNRDCYIADIWLYRSGALSNHIRYKLMFNGEQIDDYILEILG